MDPRHSATLWVGNLGLPHLSGEAIVDLILARNKTWKYLSGYKNCFGGQWIALREIRNENDATNGRCRCAIQLDPTLFREEWGWTDDHKNEGWYAHRILGVKLLSPPVFLVQSTQGKYWKLKTHDFMEESSRLLLVAHGVETPNSQQIVVSNTRNATRAQVRARKKQLRKCLREQARGLYYSFSKRDLPVYDCCRRLCASRYGCSKDQFDASQSSTQARLLSVRIQSTAWIAWLNGPCYSPGCNRRTLVMESQHAVFISNPSKRSVDVCNKKAPCRLSLTLVRYSVTASSSGCSASATTSWTSQHGMKKNSRWRCLAPE